MRPLVPAVLGLVLLAGCAAPAPGDDGGTVTVLAAASLAGPLDDVVAAFESAHPGIEVVVGFGGSSALAEQILSGAPADVFVSADEATMQKIVEAGLTADSEVLLANVLEIAVPAGNPAGVTGLADFADPGLTIALCDPAVPCGAAAVRLFELAGVTPAPDTLEEDVKAVLAKVALGEVDAALVYATDVLAADDAVEGIPVPEAPGAVNRYPVAVLTGSPAARAFVGFLRSPAALDVFREAGFRAP